MPKTPANAERNEHLRPTASTSLLIDARELARLLSVSPATLARLKAAGRIGPRPIKVSAGRVAWRRETVERWIAESERTGELIDRMAWQSCEVG